MIKCDTCNQKKSIKQTKVMRSCLDTNLVVLLYFYFSTAVSFPLHSSSCQLQGQFHLNGMQKAGDLILGGLFEIHFFSSYPDLSFTSEPHQPTCHG